MRTEQGWTAWLVGGLEVLLALSMAVWLLAIPALFQLYYPALQSSAHTADATAIVRWLGTAHRERSLNLALTGGQLNLRELQHYTDVRRVLHSVRWLTAGVTLLTALALLIARPTLPFLARAQLRGLLLWLALLLLIGGIAWWDWKTFFAWVHHPLFGDRSWRFSKEAYSLKLFPTSFWRVAAALVLLTPGLLLAIAASLIQIARRKG